RRVPSFSTARMLDAGVHDGVAYIVSEYVDGPSLQRKVQRSGPLDGDSLIRLAIATSGALAAIHKAGIVHRDFKPANVLLAPDGPRVIDFGVAKALEQTSTSTAIKGTPLYMYSGVPLSRRARRRRSRAPRCTCPRSRSTAGGSRPRPTCSAGRRR